MFGLTDIISIIYNQNSKEFNNTYKRHIIRQYGSLTWICFLPWRTGIHNAKKLGFIPKIGDVIVYEMPDNILSADPYLTLKSIKKIEGDLKNVYIEERLAEKQIAFLGISAGTLPAFYFANRYPAKKLIAVCPIDKLGNGIFTAFAAKKIKKISKKNGYSAKKYDNIIRDINPVNNISDLPDKIKIYLSLFDKFTPYSGGAELTKKLIIAKKNVKLKKFNFFGHIPVLYFFGKEKNKFTAN